jgi:hypothetical protein
MWFEGLKTRKAAEVGTSLADQVVKSLAATGNRKPNRGSGPAAPLQSLLTQVDREVIPMKLGLFRRAKLANSFKWRLLDQGLEPALVDELTRTLLMRIASKRPASSSSKPNT